ncbi:hypothetical protein MKK63_10625 [Methylobacterium sp. J-088]|nr:hypothetical protein [Methylobacterium sp. J-088]MCJ2063163.1 hypothetical protein [Methylobacterium sp. J-088]
MARLKSKIVISDEAAAILQDGAMVAVLGFFGCVTTDDLILLPLPRF